MPSKWHAGATQDRGPCLSDSVVHASWRHLLNLHWNPFQRRNPKQTWRLGKVWLLCSCATRLFLRMKFFCPSSFARPTNLHNSPAPSSQKRCRTSHNHSCIVLYSQYFISTNTYKTSIHTFDLPGRTVASLRMLFNYIGTSPGLGFCICVNQQLLLFVILYDEW